MYEKRQGFREKGMQEKQQGTRKESMQEKQQGATNESMKERLQGTRLELRYARKAARNYQEGLQKSSKELIQNVCKKSSK